MSSKYDPLEDAKVVHKEEKKPGWFGKKKDEPEGSVDQEAAPAAQPAPAAPEAPKAEEKPAVAPEVSPSKKYRVLKDKVFSYRGNVTTLKAGVVVDERGYGGPGSIDKLKDAGVELEEVKE